MPCRMSANSRSKNKYRNHFFNLVPLGTETNNQRAATIKMKRFIPIKYLPSLINVQYWRNGSGILWLLLTDKYANTTRMHRPVYPCIKMKECHGLWINVARRKEYCRNRQISNKASGRLIAFNTLIQVAYEIPVRKDSCTPQKSILIKLENITGWSQSRFDRKKPFSLGKKYTALPECTYWKIAEVAIAKSAMTNAIKPERVK